jgi:hypothetical protein
MVHRGPISEAAPWTKKLDMAMQDVRYPSVGAFSNPLEDMTHIEATCNQLCLPLTLCPQTHIHTIAISEATNN